MDAPGGLRDTEELSFGDDPDRQPWARRWVLAHRKLLAAGAAVLVLLGLLGGAGWYLYDQSRKPLPPPGGAVPEQLRFSVLLCNGGFGDCPGDGNVIARDTRRVEAALRAVPGIVSLTFLSKETSYENWRTSQEPEGELARQVTPESFRDHFLGTLARSGDYLTVAERVRRVAGVQEVERFPTGFWDDKADMAIFLCGSGPGMKCGARINGLVTDDEKQAIVDRLRGIDGVEKIYFEDRAHALMLQKHYYPEGARVATEEGDMPQTFRVKLRDAAVSRPVREAVKNMPGVEFVQGRRRE